MVKQKLSRAQRRAFAKVLQYGFLAIMAISTTVVRITEEFLECLTDEEKLELGKLKQLTHRLADRYRTMGWKLEGYTGQAPPSRARQ